MIIWNPYLPEYEYIPDGEPHVFGDRVYIYGSHDAFDGRKFCMNDYVCYSADVHNLKEWRYEGVIYRNTQDPVMTDGTRQLWAPDVVRGKDGKYYLYYCPDEDGQHIGVAVCDTPAGQYDFYGIVQDDKGGYIGQRPGDTIAFDPGVFIDEDGSIYLYSGNGPRDRESIGKKPKASVVMRLKDDMMTIAEEPKKLLPVLGEADGTSYEGHEFFEASSIRRIRGKYYLVYSTKNLHELCYAVSERPDGPFSYGGVLVSNGDVMEHATDKTMKSCYGNNHGGIECINGQYYIFYHRPTNRTMYSRQGCAEPIQILADGTIPQVEMTSQGLNGEPLPGVGIYPAACVCHLRGSLEPEIANPRIMGWKHPYLTQDAPDFDVARAKTEMPPRMYITNGEQGLSALFRYFDMKKVQSVSVVVRGNAEGRFLVRLGEDGVTVGEIKLSPAAEWTRFTGKVAMPDGVQSLCFYYEGNGKFDFLEFELN